MGQVTTIGLDIAKSVFQVHGVDAEGGVVLRRRLTRARMLPFFAKLGPCKIGIEACATSHHWARQLRALGHDVRLMPPSYVKPYVKRQKNDTADAEAICEAVTRPTMRFVEVKMPEQRSILVLHRTRLMLMRQRIQLSNAIRGHMAEFGIVAPIGRKGLQTLIEVLNDERNQRVAEAARGCLKMLADQLRLVNTQILEMDRRIMASARATDAGRRLMGIPGVGPLLASALVATIPDPHAFRSGRNLAAWIWPGAETELQRRQGATGWNHQARQPIPAADARRRGACGDPLRRAARHAPTLAGAFDGAPPDEGCRRGAGQQDGAHGLGDHDQRPTI